MADLYQSRFYKIWANMKTRCYNENIIGFHRYGGRGITVCDKWQTFGGFFDDMYQSYGEKLTIDRKDNDGNYCKENCRWATRKEQANNTRNIERALRFKHKGETLTISQWADKVGLKRTTLGMRLSNYKWSLEKALNVTI